MKTNSLSMKNIVGIILSNSTVDRADMQIFTDSLDFVKNGILLKIVDNIGENKESIFARVIGIRHIHKYLEEGDIFSFARSDRKASEIYQKIIQKRGLSYSVARLELLFTARKKNAEIEVISVYSPPKPGSWVLKVEPIDILQISIKDANDEILGIIEETGYNAKIELGELYGYYHEKVPFIADFNNITMHTAIIGTTGSGKSYTTGYFLEQLSRLFYQNKKYLGIPTVVFDANGDYRDYIEDLSKNYLVGYDNYYLITNRDQCIGIDIGVICKKPSLDLNILDPRDLAKAIILYHKGTIEGAEQQVNLLSRVLYIIKQNAARVDFNELLYNEYILDLFEASLEHRRNRTNFIQAVLTLGFVNQSMANSLYDAIEHIHYLTLEAIVRAIDEFTNVLKRHNILSRSPEINNIFMREITDPSRPSFVLFDFSAEGMPGVSLKIKQFIVYYVLYSLYNYFTVLKSRGEQRILIIVIEEAQNFAPNLYTYPIPSSIARESLALVATQGRKFGIGLVIVTQRPSYVDPIVMSMVNTWIIHRISPADIDFVLRTSGGMPKYLANRLVKLERGVAIILGQLNTLGFPVLVSFKNKRRAPHKAGTFELKNVFGGGHA